MTSGWVIVLGALVCGDDGTSGELMMRPNPPTGLQAPPAALIPAVQPGADSYMHIEWTRNGPTVRVAHRDSNGICSEWVWGRLLGRRTIMPISTTDSSRVVFFTCRSVHNGRVTGAGVERVEFIGSRWDMRIRVETTARGYAMSGCLTFYVREGITLSIGYDPMGMLTFHIDGQYDVDALPRSSVLWRSRTAARLQPYLDPLIIQRFFGTLGRRLTAGRE